MQEFHLGGKTVLVKQITVGDLKAIQRAIKGVDEIEHPTIMICQCTGMSVEEFDALPLTDLSEIERISDYIGRMIEGK